MKRILIILCIVLALLAALGGGLWLWATAQLKVAFTENPVIQAHLGKTEVTSLELSTYSAHCQEGCERFSVALKGEKGTAKAVSDVVIASSELTDGILCLDNGEVVPLTENSQILPGADGKINCD